MPGIAVGLLAGLVCVVEISDNGGGGQSSSGLCGRRLQGHTRCPSSLPAKDSCRGSRVDCRVSSRLGLPAFAVFWRWLWGPKGSLLAGGSKSAIDSYAALSVAAETRRFLVFLAVVISWVVRQSPGCRLQLGSFFPSC